MGFMVFGVKEMICQGVWGSGSLGIDKTGDQETKVRKTEIREIGGNGV